MAEEQDESGPVVLDVGSGLVKAGFAGNETPKMVFNSRKRLDDEEGGDGDNGVVGEGGQEERQLKDGEAAMRKGAIANWDAMEALWEYTLSQLNVLMDEKALLLSEAPGTQQLERERVGQVMFETYNVPHFYSANSAVLSAYHAGKVNALVVDSGHESTYVVPVWEGYPVGQGTLTFGHGGKDVSAYLARLMNEDGGYGLSEEHSSLLHTLKKKFAFASLDYEKDMQGKKEAEELLTRKHTHRGVDYSLSRARFRCAEAVFQPSLMGVESIGLHDAIYHAVQKCDLEMRDEMWSNIVVGGGNLAIANMPVRLRRAVVANAPSTANVAVDAPSNYQYSVWRGGAIVAGLTTFNHMWVSKEDYDETGPSIVNRRCIS